MTRPPGIALVESLLERTAKIGADPRDDQELRLRKALLVLIVVLVLPISIVWGGLYLTIGHGAPVGYIPLIYAAISIASLLLFARNRDVELFLHIQLVDILLAPTVSAIPLGGFLESSGVGLWGILAPLGALVFRGVASSVRWFAVFVAVFVVSGIIGEFAGTTTVLPDWFVTTMLALNIVFGGTVVFTLLALFAQQRLDALAALRVEQDKAENLLLNILPRAIAEKLKTDNSTIADQFDEASILFADVVDFTPFSQRLEPAQVVEVLDRLFTHFDVLAERYDVEKIKTIGDCYMVVAGVPRPRRDHARALAHMAIGMRDAMTSDGAFRDLGLELRIGINSGPVVAGVIGRKRFLYDLWGDAVNTASRMESSGTAGQIQVTQETYELLKPHFVLERRGTVEVKGKGEMETWYLVGPRQPQDVAAKAATTSAVAQ